MTGSLPRHAQTGFTRWKKSWKKHWMLYLLLAIPVIWLILFCYVPMYGVTMAFQDFSIRLGYFGSPWVGFKHFGRFFGSSMFGQLIGNTVILSVYSLAAEFIITILFALIINEIRGRALKKTLQMVSYLPHFISTVIIVAMLQQLFSMGGMANQLLSLLGASPQSFFTAGTFRHMYVWSGIWSGVGYGSVIYVAAMAKIDLQLYEAAVLDGANRLQKIWFIDLPSIAPTMIILLILRMGSIMGVGFEKVYLMQNNINIGVSQVISTYVYQVGMISQQYSFSAAVGIFNSVINVLFLLLANAFARRVSETSLW